MINIHLVTWNRPDMVELVVRTLNNNTHPGSYRLSVLDNASDLATKQVLINLQDQGMIQELHLMDHNAGLEAARQYLLLDCTYPEDQYFVCLDSDCLAPPIKEGADWLERLAGLMGKYEGYAAISLRTQVMIGTGEIFAEAEVAGDDILDFPHPGGSFRMMDVKAVREVGGWDRASEGRGAEERFICYKLREVGYKTAFAVNLRCLHLFGNRQRTKERWGYDESLKPEDTGHSDISHPALEVGDIRDEVLLYASIKDTGGYFHG